MFTTLRKFLVIFLAMLQLFAPLVHAHTGNKASDLGLHVPGLEILGVDHEALMSQAASHDFSSGRIGSRPIVALLTSMERENAENCLEQSRPPSRAVKGILVGVDAGMKDKLDVVVSGLDNSHYLRQQIPLFNPAAFPFDINFSPQSQQVVCRLLIPSLSPRAPPIQ